MPNIPQHQHGHTEFIEEGKEKLPSSNDGSSPGVDADALLPPTSSTARAMAFHREVAAWVTAEAAVVQRRVFGNDDGAA